MDKAHLSVGDTVVVCVDTATGQREIGVVTAVGGGHATVALDGGESVDRALEHIDRPIELHPDEMQARVARGIAAVEAPADRDAWAARFEWLLGGWRFVPGGRILTAAGTDQNLTFYNCYVIPNPRDSRDGIFTTLSQMAEIMSRGGGVGINLSSLRPRYAYVRGVNGRSSGAVSWGSVYSFVTGLIEQGGSRRGALMLILNVWHPDVAEFIEAKRTMGRITNANISVGITDDFMAAVQADGDWELVFPDTNAPAYDTAWDGDLAAWRAAGHPVIAYKTVRARELWDTIIESAWASAEPGVWFGERTNQLSNSWYFAPIICTNPCGEQGLPAWGVCNLGALNLARFHTPAGEVDWPALGQGVRYAVRFLDDVIDATPYHFAENEAQQKSERRVGLGTMGLAELMVRCGVRYGSAEGNAFCDGLFAFISREAYLASSDIAAEKGSFPRFEAEPLLQSGYMLGMPDEVRDAVRAKGLRNVTLLTQAPTGTTGTMVNTSTGIEPFFSWSFYRKSRLGWHEETVAVVNEWRAAHPDAAELPAHFVTAMDLTPLEHVGAQAAIQRWIDSAISKTCNVPAEYTIEQTRTLYEEMYRLGCKGGTIYRDGSRNEQVLHRKDDGDSTTDDAADAVPLHAGGELAGGGGDDAVGTASSMRAWPTADAIRRRPRQTVGRTVRVNTPFGKAYVTVNLAEENEPFEVFVNVGKAGSDLAADAEAMGRLISLLLRMPSRLRPSERLRLVVDELEGIGGSRHVGFGPDRVRSIPDGIASALRDATAGDSGAEAVQPGLFPASAEDATAIGSVQGPSGGVPDGHGDGTDPAPHMPGGDLCPSCHFATFVHIEGCQKCFTCGYSEC
ncbi:MAG: adenosylcobalamin-dependent ribonucleoside-diphosphate reductase [Ardenticatenales bacterium]|nr:adenosylcobalamin-dependent ribonucleoside-diphosphate reductase [Ardenticatenales bacterium]